MKFLFALFMAIVSIYASSFKSEKVLEMKESEIEISNKNGIKVGQSGFLFRDFDTKNGSILAVATVIKTDNQKAIVKVENSDYLKQSSLPTLKSNISKGDTFFFDVYSNRALLITPNQDSYITISKNLKEYSLIHPDIFSSYLMANNKLSPTISSFKEFCMDNSVGTLFIANENVLHKLDCLSFYEMNKYSVNFKQDEFISPFYSRVGELEVNWFVFGEKRVDNYSEFYKNLIR
ncbi:MAG: plasminogen-binding N-terminal domain-containing protein [Campylobacterales bacterium]|nr:plasminogen-binding N-terminal domain-containing protein [Campylobacterales bacterium]